MNIIKRNILDPDNHNNTMEIIELELPSPLFWRWAGVADETWESFLRESLRGRGTDSTETTLIVSAIQSKLNQ